MKLVRVPLLAAPKGYLCRLCNRKLKPDQIALYDRDKSGEFKRAYHADCVKELLSSEPEVIIEGKNAVEKEFLRIRKEIENGRVWA